MHGGVTIRPIRPEDREALAAAHSRLSPESIRRRYLSAKPRLTERDLTYLTDVDGVDHVALVLVEDGEIVGVGRWVRLPDDPTTAEVAVVIADARQGQGLGRRLGLALADSAVERGIARFNALLLSDNVAAHRLFASISRRLDSRHEAGLEELVLELPAAA
jgi:RimJ/RimL family protein N-acetyltransferase